MSIFYYTADVSHLVDVDWWEQWLNNLPEKFKQVKNSPYDLAKDKYVCLMFEDSEFFRIVSDDSLVVEDLHTTEIVIPWEDLNEAITGELYANSRGA